MATYSCQTSPRLGNAHHWILTKKKKVKEKSPTYEKRFFNIDKLFYSISCFFFFIAADNVDKYMFLLKLNFVYILSIFCRFFAPYLVIEIVYLKKGEVEIFLAWLWKILTCDGEFGFWMRAEARKFCVLKFRCWLCFFSVWSNQLFVEILSVEYRKKNVSLSMG